VSLVVSGVVLRHAQDQFAVNGKRLDDDVVAFPVGVGESCANVDPEIISTLALYDHIDAVRGLRTIRHGASPSMAGDGMADEDERFLE
jgi:hypothetical protein